MKIVARLSLLIRIPLLLCSVVRVAQFSSAEYKGEAAALGSVAAIDEEVVLRGEPVQLPCRAVSGQFERCRTSALDS